ncbi:MAG: type II secretion system GspH family protein [Candidatus Pacebacteria bacterium]|nr:type II secretion system GspH family protein [Candidatus Paceibacterota bacterium]
MKENYKNKKEQTSAVSPFRAPFRRNGGFTLVEMLVVILILALIIVFAFTAFNISRNKTRDAVLMSEIEQVKGIAESVYHPSIGYKELWEMRGSAVNIDDDYPTIKQIRKRARDVGSDIRIWFPEDAGVGLGFDQYCAYAYPLFYEEGMVFCVDSLGNEIIEDPGNINCTDLYSPANCEYRD